jgi:predicted anti-sigma-YlaC factor YlaD
MEERDERPARGGVLALAAWLLVAGGGCSIRGLAVNALADSLAAGGTVYASDEDPELVGDALPFALKTLESLLAAEPDHRGLLLAAASGFTQYAYAFVQQEADFVEAQDLARATELRVRARRLYLRAQRYGWRGLEADFPGLRAELQANPQGAAVQLARLERRHVPLLYWTAAPWAAAIALAKEDAELTADLTLVEAMMRRALALDEGFGHGAIHDFFVAFEASRGAAGGTADAARRHCERAQALSGGRRVGPLVSCAEAVAVAAQDRAEFERLLRSALAIDPAALPEERLANVLAQRRARWLLARADELFIE